MYEIDIMPPPRKGGTITHKDCRLVLLLTKKKKNNNTKGTRGYVRTMGQDFAKLTVRSSQTSDASIK
jgi:hypothetical protein